MPAVLSEAWSKDEPTRDASASPAARGAGLGAPSLGARRCQCAMCARLQRVHQSKSKIPLSLSIYLSLT